MKALCVFECGEALGAAGVGVSPESWVCLVQEGTSFPQ